MFQCLLQITQVIVVYGNLKFLGQSPLNDHRAMDALAGLSARAADQRNLLLV
jgi:hypothetical protein